jgi:hypothetical protein
MNLFAIALCLTGLCLAYMWVKIIAHRMARDMFEEEREAALQEWKATIKQELDKCLGQ